MCESREESVVLPTFYDEDIFNLSRPLMVLLEVMVMNMVLAVMGVIL